MSSRLLYPVLGLILLGVTGWTYKTGILDEEGAVQSEMVALQREISSLEEYNRKRVPLTEELRQFEVRTLGSTSEEVEHALRVLLHEIGTANRLSDLSVDSHSRNPVQNPATRRSRAIIRDKSERERPDFVPVEGSLNGSGSLAQVTAAVAQLQSQEWMHRISDLRLTPRDGGRRIDLRVTLSTIYFPGAARAAADHSATSTDSEARARAEVIAARALFSPVQPTPEKPVEVVKPTPTPPPVKPTPLPYGKWRITGFGRGGQGPILYLVGPKQATQTLGVGEEVLNMVFRGLEGPFVVLELGGKQYYFGEGDTLDRRDEARRSD